MPWLWNTQLTQVLMIGLGGASTQRAYQRYDPDVTVETGEIDPKVAEVARQFSHYEESARPRVQISDGCKFLRRSQTDYGATSHIDRRLCTEPLRLGTSASSGDEGIL